VVRLEAYYCGSARSYSVELDELGYCYPGKADEADPGHELT
jgi:hypothetical protein